eukprot:TRINITY_DN40493_c0_g2_i1.p2 TRINITY_DN40493_c0_g2~~TRINITY_DN40493_c0_g2_i1.p2  ORF type:complete len:122 (+),score=43.19 TRINITY_DN40493_c0_g2_i1:84-449(+)
MCIRDSPNAGLSRQQRRRKMFEAEDGPEAIQAGFAAQKAHKTMGAKKEAPPERSREKIQSFEDSLISAKKKPSLYAKEKSIEKQFKAAGGKGAGGKGGGKGSGGKGAVKKKLAKNSRYKRR